MLKISRRLAGALVAAAAFAAPVAGAYAQSTLKVALHSDLKIVDPVWTTALISTHHGYMVYDTLFALDNKLQVQPQMVDKWEVSPDKLTWTFTLRDGLEWHDGKPVTVHFLFGATPKAIRPGEIELSTGTLEADLVVTCIGYSGEEFPKRDDVFPVGWAKRGPTGTIPTNRAESHAVAQQVLAFLKDRDPKSGPDVLPIAVDAAGWHRIDKHEVAAGAAQGRPRVKLTEWQTLLDIAQGG